MTCSPGRPASRPVRSRPGARTFLAAGREGLKARPRQGEERELTEAQRKIGELQVPDTLWATDATEGWSKEGHSAIFAIIDHALGEVFCDASLRIGRFAVADLLREVDETERFGSVERAVAAGLALRYDGGPCFRSAHYQPEIDHLGIARSPAYHYEPETNGCIERFMGTLKEQVLWIERFDTHQALRARVRAREHLTRQALLP